MEPIEWTECPEFGDGNYVARLKFGPYFLDFWVYEDGRSVADYGVGWELYQRNRDGELDKVDPELVAEGDEDFNGTLEDAQALAVANATEAVAPYAAMMLEYAATAIANADQRNRERERRACMIADVKRIAEEDGSPLTSEEIAELEATE